MRRSLTISRAALIDLDAAARWLMQPGAGHRAGERLRRIRSTLRRLKHKPVQWSFGSERGIREATSGGYRILYRVEPDTGETATSGDVTVLRVFGPGQSRGRGA